MTNHPRSRKNVLILMSDQHASRVTGCYGNDTVTTPHLDHLAERGTVFNSAWTPSPICVPARAALATGRYVHETGNWDNAAPYVGDEAASWGHRLTASGVRVATFGKLHYRARDDDSGFEEQHLPLHVKNGVGDVSQLLRGDRPPSHGLRDVIKDAGPGESDYTRYDRNVASSAAEWVRASAASDQPWCAMVSLVSPHYPLIAPEHHFQQYAGKELPAESAEKYEEWDRHPVAADYRRRCRTDEPFDEVTIAKARAAYYGLVSFMDEQLGVVLGALEESGQLEDTLVLYTSDHGENLGAHGLWFKSTMHETSLRVPMIVRVPGQAAATVNTPVSLVDVFPTVLAWQGVALTDEDASLPGRNLLEIAREPADSERSAFSEYHAIHSSDASYALRRGRWKLQYFLGGPPLLYDLDTDPGETRDLASDPDHESVLDEMLAALRAIVDPEELDRRVKGDQARRLDELGGREAVLEGTFFSKPFTPIPQSLNS